MKNKPSSEEKEFTSCLRRKHFRIFTSILSAGQGRKLHAMFLHLKSLLTKRCVERRDENLDDFTPSSTKLLAAFAISGDGEPILIAEPKKSSEEKSELPFFACELEAQQSANGVR